jgi:hypothetical protein
MKTHFFQTTRSKVSAALLFGALAVAVGVKAYARVHASGDCCAPSAACCHPGSPCCHGQKGT